jgi:hypothetical protein
VRRSRAPGRDLQRVLDVQLHDLLMPRR